MKPPFRIIDPALPPPGEEGDFAIVDADNTIIGEFWHLCPRLRLSMPAVEDARHNAELVCMLLNKHFEEAADET